VFWNPGERVNVAEREALEAAAPTLGLRLLSVPVRQGDDLEAAFTTIRESCDAIYVAGGDFLQQDRPRLVGLVAQHRVPAVYPFREYVALGGLMSYGTNLPIMYRRAASYMDRVLRGTKPSELPVEQPTRFDLVINGKTADDLGITLPASLDAQVTEIVR